MPDLNRQIILANRPDGYPVESDFELVESSIPAPVEGEILVRTIYLSVDPYMRGRMNVSQKSYAAPVGDREVITGGVVGEVVKSKRDQFQVGDIAQRQLGWQAYGTMAGEDARKIDPDLAPISTSLGKLTKLEEVSLYSNQLSGCVPKCIDVCASTISGHPCYITTSGTNPGITGRCPCDCGEYHRDGTTCTACEAGSYESSHTACAACNSGRWADPRPIHQPSGPR